MGNVERERIGKNLKRARGERGLRELGKAAGISHASLSQFERGLHEPAAGTLGRLAATLRVSADFLLGLTDDPVPAAERPFEVSRTERAFLEDYRLLSKDDQDDLRKVARSLATAERQSATGKRQKATPGKSTTGIAPIR